MKINKTAIIYGVTGQTGSHLADLLVAKDYYVIGVKRRTSLLNTARIDHLYDKLNFKLEYGDMNDISSMFRLLLKYKPDEVYSLAAQSHVRVSFDLQENTADTIAMGTLRLLNAVHEIVPNARFYNSCSSEVFGKVQEIPQKETTPFYPRSIYGCAKAFTFWTTVNYREAYNLYASNGILFNHEGERRGETFVSRKITLAAARIKLGLQNELFLGNLKSKRDWGYAGDYANAINLILQQEQPDDYIIATGETYSVKDFVIAAFDYFGLDWKKYVKIDQKYFRPTEVDILIGDASKARKKLGWQPKVKFYDLVKLMCESDFKLMKEKYNL